MLEELITRRRRQILVHSCIYYRLNTSIISDYTFDQWAKELAELQDKYPDIAEKCKYAEYFKSFNGASGYDLPIHLPEIVSKAMYLVELMKQKRRGN